MSAYSGVCEEVLAARCLCDSATLRLCDSARRDRAAMWRESSRAVAPTSSVCPRWEKRDGDGGEVATFLKLRLLAQAARVVQAELSGAREAQLEVELDVEVRAVGEGLPASMAGDRQLSGTPAICRAVVPPRRKEWPEYFRERSGRDVSHPAAHVTNEGEVGERSAAGSVVEEVRHRRVPRAGGQKPGVGAVRRHGAQAVVASDDDDCRGDESGLGEGDGEADAPGMHGDVLAEQAAARVLLDAEQAEEGEQTGTPAAVAGVGELAQVEARTDGVQVVDESEAANGSGDVVVAVPVEDAGSDALEGAASRQVGVAHAHGVVGDGGHEAGEAGDAVVLDVQDADAAELDLRERS